MLYYLPVLRIHDILGWIRIRGSMPLTNGSGFGSGSWIRILLFSSLTPSRCQQKTNFFNTIFSAYYFLKLHLHHFSKIKSQKQSQNSRNQGFSYQFCMMIEGSGSRAGSGSGSIHLTSGSGSGRPKNMWIRWIRIRIRIRIRNTATYNTSRSVHISQLIISTENYFSLLSFRQSAHLSWSYRGGFLVWVSPRMQPSLAQFLCFYYLFNKTRYVKSRCYIGLLYTHASFRTLGITVGGTPTVSKSRKVEPGTVPIWPDKTLCFLILNHIHVKGLIRQEQTSLLILAVAVVLILVNCGTPKILNFDQNSPVALGTGTLRCIQCLGGKHEGLFAAFILPHFRNNIPETASIVDRINIRLGLSTLSV